MSVPTIGSIFPSFDTVRDFIIAFATINNTCISMRNTRRCKNTGEYHSAAFVCERYGKYSGRKREGFKTKRTECPFAIRVFRRYNGVYAITNTILIHNHNDVCLLDLSLELTVMVITRKFSLLK